MTSRAITHKEPVVTESVKWTNKYRRQTLPMMWSHDPFIKIVQANTCFEHNIF